MYKYLDEENRKKRSQMSRFKGLVVRIENARIVGFSSIHKHVKKKNSLLSCNKIIANKRHDIFSLKFIL